MTKTISLTLFGFLLLMVSSCAEKENQITKPNETGPNIEYSFKIQNSKGNDLLNPDVAGHFPHDALKLYTDANLTDDVSGYLYLTTPEQTAGDDYYLDLRGFGDTKINDSVSEGTRYLQLSETIVDTITTQLTFFNNSNFQTLTKLVYNGKVLFDDVPSKGIWNKNPVIIK